MKLWQVLALITLSFLVVAGSVVGGRNTTADAAPQVRSVAAPADLLSPISGPLPGHSMAAPQAEDYGAQVVKLVNGQRAAAGLSPLREVAALHDAADWHNLWMSNNNCFAHICPGEPDPGQRAVNAGYPSRGVGENIAAGYVSPESAVTGWMNSAGHRAAILGNYTDIGCGYIRNPATSYGTYWTCDFGGVGNVGPAPSPTAATPARPPLPPAGWVMRVELQPSAGWQAWDDLYYKFCASPLAGVTCKWYRP